MAGKRKLYVGPQVRRIRRARAETQAAFAAALGVSASYINLIERNQRPASADFLLRLAELDGVDLSSLREDGGDETLARLASALQDPIFRAAGVTREDLAELAAGLPTVGEALAALFEAWRASQAELLDARASGRAAIDDPVEEARAFLQANHNHFPALDAEGERLAAEIGRGDGGAFSRLAARLSDAHGIRTRVLPHAVMTGAVRRLNRHARELALSESLDGASRTFQIALQLALIEQGAAFDRIVNAGRFESDAGRRLARAAVANYAAAAIIMPYAAFLGAAVELAYDIEALARRFGASFEQVAHRLTTLRRPGAEGVAFFFLRVDAAGNVSKRFSGDIFPFARYGGGCPVWNIHEAFRTPRRILTQAVALPDGSAYFSIARTVQSEIAGFGEARAERVVALGCAIEDAPRLVYARADMAEPTPIGVTCRLCERADCAARAHPPIRRRMVIDEHRQFAAPFSFTFD